MARKNCFISEGEAVIDWMVGSIPLANCRGKTKQEIIDNAIEDQIKRDKEPQAELQKSVVFMYQNFSGLAVFEDAAPVHGGKKHVAYLDGSVALRSR